MAWDTIYQFLQFKISEQSYHKKTTNIINATHITPYGQLAMAMVLNCNEMEEGLGLTHVLLLKSHLQFLWKGWK